mmetsp:Transcript_35529/g.95364  ORF Transcript_35529/g.95364 Transcript_35529/m.95364 type:complete len:373 (-) Transcript_35529:192-1310(-)
MWEIEDGVVAKIRALVELFPTANVARMVEKQPALLAADPATLESNASELRRLLPELAEADVGYVVERAPSVIQYDPLTVEMNLSYLSDLLPGVNRTKLIRAMPTLLQLDMEANIGPKVRILRRLFDTDAKLVATLEANPSLLAYSAAKFTRLLFESEMKRPVRLASTYYRVGPRWMRNGPQSHRLRCVRLGPRHDAGRAEGDRAKRGRGAACTIVPRVVWRTMVGSTTDSVAGSEGRDGGPMLGRFGSRLRCHVDRTAIRTTLKIDATSDDGREAWLSRIHRPEEEYREWLRARLACLDAVKGKGGRGAGGEARGGGASQRGRAGQGRRKGSSESRGAQPGLGLEEGVAEMETRHAKCLKNVEEVLVRRAEG